jgi:hypothetical protein
MTRAPRNGGRCTSDGYKPLRRYRFWWSTKPVEWLDNLIHQPRMAWVPRPLTGWVCDVMDWKLGLSWDEIRRARHGKRPGYTNQLDWVNVTAKSSTASTLGNVTVHYKTGEQA